MDDDERVRDEFERLDLRQELEKDQAMIRQYEEGLAFRRLHVQEVVYALGRLDERLEGGQA